MKRLLALTLIFSGIALCWYYWQHPLASRIKIRGTMFTVDLALTTKQKEIGLGGRSSMPQQHGMLFSYDHKEQFEFWMKGMKFPLDFIWIDDDRVVDLSLSIPPPEGNEQPLIVKPSVGVDKILEVNAGVVSKIGIQIGDTVEYIDR